MRKLKQELWPHMVTLNKVDSSPEMYLIESWLEQNISYITGKWYVVCYPNKSDFYFRTGADATWFTLKWT